MRLPKNLISEFVKITNDQQKEKAETTVYGRIVKNGGNVYVRLDGSDILTPVTTTTDTLEGERVTVLIKNHTATVTGNITSPAARTDDVQQIGSEVNNLNEENVTINDRIDNLQATKIYLGDTEPESGPTLWFDTTTES